MADGKETASLFSENDASNNLNLKPAAKEVEEIPEFYWHGSMEEALSTDIFVEKCKIMELDINCPLAVAAIAGIVSDKIFPKRVEARKDGNLSAKSLANLQKFRQYFSPTMLAMEISPCAKRWGTHQ